MRTGLGAILCCLLLGCCQLGSFSTAPPSLKKGDKSQFPSDEVAMKRDEVKQIVVGMPIKEAKALLEARKLRCSYDCDDVGHRYLDCSACLERKWCMTEYLDVIVLYDEGRVTDVKARMRVIAL